MSWKKYLNPVHAIEHAVSWLNDITGSDPGGPSGTPNFEDGHATANILSTDTLTGPEQQAINTTAYMENGGNTNMFGSNTAYNEDNNNNGSWWDRNQDWLIPTLTTIGTTAAGMIYNNHQQNKTNEFNANQAQLNRDYQTEMSNTAHQREYADLLATGLNPVNTATGGSGASTPGGSAGAGTAPAYMDHASMANTALSLAETMKVLNENKFIKPEKKAQIANTIADTTNKSANTELTHANKDLIKEQTKQIKIDNITREDMNRIEMALKSNQSKDVLQSAISKAIENAYHAETGTAANMTMAERIANLAANAIYENVKNGRAPDPVGAIQKAIKEIE